MLTSGKKDHLGRTVGKGDAASIVANDEDHGERIRGGYLLGFLNHQIPKHSKLEKCSNAAPMF